MWVHAQQRWLSHLSTKLPLEVSGQGPHELSPTLPFLHPLFSAQ